MPEQGSDPATRSQRAMLPSSSPHLLLLLTSSASSTSRDNAGDGVWQLLRIVSQAVVLPLALTAVKLETSLSLDRTLYACPPGGSVRQLRCPWAAGVAIIVE